MPDCKCSSYYLGLCSLSGVHPVITLTQAFPSSTMTPPPRLISIHPTCDFFTEYLCATSPSSSSAKRDPGNKKKKKARQNRLMPSSSRILQVQICCVLVQTVPPGFLESKQPFPFHLSKPKLHHPTTHLPAGPPAPSSPGCTGVVTPQATMYGQVLISASLSI